MRLRVAGHPDEVSLEKRPYIIEVVRLYTSKKGISQLSCNRTNGRTMGLSFRSFLLVENLDSGACGFFVDIVTSIDTAAFNLLHLASTTRGEQKKSL